MSKSVWRFVLTAGFLAVAVFSTLGMTRAPARSLVTCFQCSQGPGSGCFPGEHVDYQFFWNDLHGDAHWDCEDGSCESWITYGGHKNYGGTEDPTALAATRAALLDGGEDAILDVLRDFEHVHLNQDRLALQVSDQQGDVVLHVPVDRALGNRLMATLALSR